MGLFSIIGDLLQATAAEDASAPVATVNGVTITVGELEAVIQFLGNAQLSSVFSSNFSTLDKAVILGQDALAVFAIVMPADAPLASLASFALGVLKNMGDAGVITIKPDPMPIQDAQTAASDQTHGRYIGR